MRNPLSDYAKIKKLHNEALKLNHKYENKISNGGCGTFALYFSTLLDRYNIQNSIVYLPETNTPAGAFRCDIKFTHIMVKTPYFYIDNVKLCLFIGSLNTIDLSKDKLRWMLQDHRYWNTKVFLWHWNYSLAEDILRINL